VLRSRLREAIVGVPRAVQREVLQAIETARESRQTGRSHAWTPPEMTRDELIREVKWRLDSAGLDEVEAAARVIDRTARRGRGAARRGQA
jgi:hypothetical protein